MIIAARSLAGASVGVVSGAEAASFAVPSAGAFRPTDAVLNPSLGSTGASFFEAGEVDAAKSGTIEVETVFLPEPTNVFPSGFVLLPACWARTSWKLVAISGLAGVGVRELIPGGTANGIRV